MIDVALQTYLAGLTADPVQQDVIPQTVGGDPRVWFQRRQQEQAIDCDGTPGLVTTEFDLEVQSLDIDQCQALAATLRQGLHGYRGPMGGQTVLAAFVEDQSDDYVSKSLSADEGYHIAAFKLTLISGAA